ncbi:MAG: sulfatase [Planctomycetota bacterium]
MPHLLLLLLSALIAVAACDDEPDPVAAPFGPIRLVDRLNTASIRSPLTGVAPAQDLTALAAAAEELLAQDFAAFDPVAAGWPKGLKPVPIDGNPALRVRRFNDRVDCGWILPAEPRAHYAFERRARAKQAAHVDFAVLEISDGTLDDVRGVHTRPGLKLRFHWPRPLVPDAGWQEDSVAFYTTPKTQALAVVLMRRAGVAGDVGAVEGTVEFDDLRVDRLRPTPDQTLALLKARDLAPDADPDLGIAKFGQFPPLGEAEGRHSAFDDNFSFRRALYAPPPTELAFPLAVPPGATLRFSVALWRETAVGAAARFEVLARTAGGDRPLWSRDLEAGTPQWRWHEAQVDLAELSGRELSLVFRTEALAGQPHPVWGHPVVLADVTGAAPRNVILIAVDTLRADRLSCYGYERPTTPHVDALAEDGVRFDQVAANANWTCPSFASIFTGVVPSRHGVFSYGPQTPLPSGLRTLAERFRDHGFATQAIAYKPALYDGGYEQGFDVALTVPRLAVRGDDNLAEALEWLEANATGRNFLFLHFDDPHQPFTQPEPFDTAYRRDADGPELSLPFSAHRLGEQEDDPAIRAAVRELYDGEVAFVDDCIGRFLAALRQRGLYDDAVIVFVADHGEQLWEHGAFGHGPHAAHDARMLYDEVVRVPLIVKPGPGGFARGAVVPTQVRGFDVMPTLMELAGLDVDPTLDAQSLVPLLRVRDDAPADRLAVIESSSKVLALRNRAWKYVLDYTKLGKPGEQLYELREDPGEERNLARRRGDTLAELRGQLLEYLLLHRPGQYLVSIAGEPPQNEWFRVVGASSATTFFGAGGRPAREGGVRFNGRTTDRLAVFAALDTLAPVQVEESGRPLHEARPYEAGTLARLLEAAEPGDHLFLGPPADIAAEAALRDVDAQQLEALHQLGYTGKGH